MAQTQGLGGRNMLREQVPCPSPSGSHRHQLLAGPGLPRAAEGALESHKVLLWAPAVGSCVTTGMPPSRTPVVY